MPDDPRAEFYRQMMTPERRKTYAQKLRTQAQNEPDSKKADILNWVAGNYEKPLRESRASQICKLAYDVDC